MIPFQWAFLWTLAHFRGCVIWISMAFITEMCRSKAKPKSQVTAVSALIVYEVGFVFSTCNIASIYLHSYALAAHILFRPLFLPKILFTVFEASPIRTLTFEALVKGINLNCKFLQIIVAFIVFISESFIFV